MGRGGGSENEDAADIKALLLDDKRVKALATKGRSEAMILAHRKVSCVVYCYGRKRDETSNFTSYEQIILFVTFK